MFAFNDLNEVKCPSAWISGPIPLLPERPHPGNPWDEEPGIDEPILPEDPGEVPDDPDDEEDDFP
jgi:hypothetical protein